MDESIPPDRFLTTKEMAALLRVKPGTLEKARSTGLGNYPPFVRIGSRRIGYPLSSYEKWRRANSYNGDGSPTYPE